MLRIILLGMVAIASLSAQDGHSGMGGDFSLLRAEFGVANKVVQGAPYSAQSVTTFTQNLANGDHIQRTTSASVARDSQGRTRTERSFQSIGALTGATTTNGNQKSVMIFDPVAGKSYVLDAMWHTARSMTAPAARQSASLQPHRDLVSAKTEDLGTQTIQGLLAHGRRVTRVIPAGRQGNEKEIDIVSETWYSTELQAVVMSKTSDPRFGESVYQLNSISRAEPDAALFIVPTDYSVREGHPHEMPHRAHTAAQ